MEREQVVSGDGEKHEVFDLKVRTDNWPVVQMTSGNIGNMRDLGQAISISW